MKKILIVCLLIFDSIYASMMYEDTIEKSQTYINSFQDYKIYLINSTNIPYKYENKMLSVDSRFTSNGFLNIDEFLMSKNIKGNSYLFNGFEYFTMSERDDSVYVISNDINGYELKSKTDLSNIKTTYYIKDYIKVTGTGTFKDPWKFKKPKFKIKLNLTKVKINNSYLIDEVVNTNEVSYELVPDENTVIDGKFICDGLFDDYVLTDSELRFIGINSDIECTLKYKIKTHTAQIVVNKGKPSSENLAIDYNESKSVTIEPEEGYAFSGALCTNSQKYSYNNYIFKIENITADTKCTIDYVYANKDINYTGSSQSYIIPSNGNYTIEACGAQGGSFGSIAVGGKGGCITGRLKLEKGKVLTINVGGENGYNGGGVKSGTVSGGGATTITLSGVSLLTAAGGGASGKSNSSSYIGGDGGNGNGSGGVVARSGGSAGINGSNGGGGSSSTTVNYDCNCDEKCDTCYKNSSTCAEYSSWSYVGCTSDSFSNTYSKTEKGKCPYNSSKNAIYERTCKKYKQTSYDCNCKTECDTCHAYGKPGSGGTSSLNSSLIEISKTDGKNEGNGYVKITYYGE